MLKRDKYQIVVQHNFEAPDAEPDSEAEGDSAARTGPLAAAGSAHDMRLTNLFVLPSGELVRHPFAPKWKDPKLTSRDQVVQFSVCRSFAASRTARYYADKGSVNSDWLSPSVRLYLRRVGAQDPSLVLSLIGGLDMWLSLIWNTKVRPKEELNQFICMCIVAGPKWASRLLNWHPSIVANLGDYWSGWRDQPEVGQALYRLLCRKAAE